MNWHAYSDTKQTSEDVSKAKTIEAKLNQSVNESSYEVYSHVKGSQIKVPFTYWIGYQTKTNQETLD